MPIDALRVMTWNLQRGEGAEGDVRALRAAAAIVREAPEVVALQEALPRQLARLAEALPAMRLVPGEEVHHRERNAFLHRPDRTRLVARGTYPLPDGGGAPRAASWARFATARGREVEVVDVHLDHESAEHRERAVALLRAEHPDALLLGDFNARPGSPPHEALRATHRDAHPVPGPSTIGRDGPSARLDWVMVPRRDMPLEARRVAPFPPASDHDALRADVALGPEGPA